MALTVGFDLASVADVQDAVRTIGERYLRKIYTAGELADCERDPRRLAARFAAKEATMKALKLGDEAIPWQSIEMLVDPDGNPSIQLRGAAADLAGARGFTDLALSLVPGRRVAAAIVVAQDAS